MAQACSVITCDTNHRLEGYSHASPVVGSVCLFGVAQDRQRLDLCLCQCHASSPLVYPPRHHDIITPPPTTEVSLDPSFLIEFLASILLFLALPYRCHPVVTTKPYRYRPHPISRHLKTPQTANCPLEPNAAA